MRASPENYIVGSVPLQDSDLGYHDGFVTATSQALDIAFGLQTLAGLRPCPTARFRLKMAREHHLGYDGSESTFQVIKYFVEGVGEQVGYFLAFPADEMINVTRFTRNDLEVARQRGYLRLAYYPSIGKELAELSEKFTPLF